MLHDVLLFHYKEFFRIASLNGSSKDLDCKTEQTYHVFQDSQIWLCNRNWAKIVLKQTSPKRLQRSQKGNHKKLAAVDTEVEVEGPLRLKT